MKALRQLGFLKLSLRPDGTPDEDHRVLALFRNRAELKKAYGGLQEEAFRLKDLIKQQEGATQRVQEMLSTLEGRLGTPETAYSALVFYQLRRLWQTGRELITAFVADLLRQQDERELRAHVAQYNRRQFARRESAAGQLRAAQGVHQQALAQVASLEGERAKLTRFWHYFKRRALQQRLAGAAASLGAASAALAEAEARLEELARETMPEFAGLSLIARRAINLAAIGYAEVLCQRLAPLKSPLLRLARDAIAQREASDAYGSPRECVLLMGQVSRAQRLIAARAGLAGEITGCCQRLKRVARYRSEADSAPLADSLSLAQLDLVEAASKYDAARLPNVLAEDTWDLFRILLR